MPTSTSKADGAVHTIAEIENHTGIAEKTLSEFILALSKQCKAVKEFKKTLDSNGAEFPESLVNTLWNIIQAMQVRQPANVFLEPCWLYGRGRPSGCCCCARDAASR